jgi:hypothetical protein
MNQLRSRARKRKMFFQDKLIFLTATNDPCKSNDDTQRKNTFISLLFFEKNMTSQRGQGFCDNT